MKPEALPPARRYPEDVRDEAVASVEKRRLLNPRDRSIYREVAAQFEVGEQSLRLWVKKHDAEVAARNAMPPMIATEADGCDAGSMERIRLEMESMRQKIEKLQAENEVLKRAFVVFSSEWSKK